MNKSLTPLIHTIDHITEWSSKAISLLVVFIMLIVMYEVVSRYFFSKPTIWALEMSTMMFGTYMMLAGAYSLFAGNFVNVDILYARWSKRTRAIVDLITFPLVIVFLSILFWKTMVYSIESLELLEYSSSAWGQPLYHWKMTAPIGVLLLTLQSIGVFLRNLALVVTGEEIR